MKVHYNFTIFRIWDTGEAGILTVLPPPPESRHYKRSKASAKKLSLTNAALILLCLPSFLLGGTHIPPVFIFQRNFFLPSMKQAGSAGWIGLAHPSGWINADTFL
jgi:hypothetical protein